MNNERKFGLYFKIIHNSFEKRFNKILAPYDLTLSQFDILAYLISNRDRIIKQKDIEKILNLENPTVTGLVKRIEAKNLLHAQTDPDDRRCRSISINENGIRLMDEIRIKIIETDQVLLHHLTEDEICELDRMLRIVIQNISND